MERRMEREMERGINRKERHRDIQSNNINERVNAAGERESERDSDSYLQEKPGWAVQRTEARGGQETWWVKKRSVCFSETAGGWTEETPWREREREML